MRDWKSCGHYINMEKSALLQSHDELRAVLRLAGAELKKKSIGRKDSPLLQLMRRVLREARIIANAERAAKTKGAGA
jgi:hypothetical protein